MIEPHAVEVALGTRAYRVIVGEQLEIGPAVGALGLGRRCAVVTDANVGPLYAERAIASLKAAGFQPVLITVEAGEKSKALSVAESVCNEMIRAGLDRKGWVVALGGGVIGDLAGFVAAIYYRGIPFVQVPTTIIAQVDSAVGGKTGVNTALGKNLLGAFHQPRLVLADVAMLRSLPPREFNEGFAEVIKHGAIRDRSLLDAIAGGDLQNEPGRLAAIIRRNVEIKSAIVAADEHETTGERALLNFGHTVGHGIENAAGYGRYLHGEAISLGLMAALWLSERKAGLPAQEARLMRERLEAFGLPTRLPDDLSTEVILHALQRDKKFEEGAIRFVLSPRLGEAFVSKAVTQAEVTAAIEAIR